MIKDPACGEAMLFCHRHAKTQARPLRRKAICRYIGCRGVFPILRGERVVEGRLGYQRPRNIISFKLAKKECREAIALP